MFLQFKNCFTMFSGPVVEVDEAEDNYSDEEDLAPKQVQTEQTITATPPKPESEGKTCCLYKVLFSYNDLLQRVYTFYKEYYHMNFSI